MGKDSKIFQILGKEEIGHRKKYYNKADLQEIFGFGRDKMKKILAKNIIPTVKVNKDYLISKDELDKWLKNNAGKSIII